MPPDNDDHPQSPAEEESERRAYELIALAFNNPAAIVPTVRKDPALLNERTGLFETPLHYLAVENQLDAVKSLIDLGASVDVRNAFDETPLHEAAQLGYVEMVRLLLDHQADVHSKNKYGETPLHSAASGGSVSVILLLLDRGAAVNAMGKCNETPLDEAILADHADATDILRKAGGTRGTGAMSF